MISDDRKLYISIRNGTIAKIDTEKIKNVTYNKVSNSSIWKIISSDDFLYGGNVDGHFIVIDKNNLKVIKDVKVHKKNLKSLFKYESFIYTASQDKSIAILDTNKEYEIIRIRNNIHKKMFQIAGVWNDILISICFPNGELSFWSLKSLDHIKTITISPSLTGETAIKDNILFLASRSINGLLALNLNNIISDN
jgi:hypothetical protein